MAERNSPSVSPSTRAAELIDFGLRVERLITKTNQTTQGLIMIFFSSSIASLTVMCFLIVSHLGLSETQEYNGKHLLTSCHSLIAVLYLIRVYSIMASGQELSVKVKRSRRTLEDAMMEGNLACVGNNGECDKVDILRKRLEIYQYLCPISPYAVFTLSTKTFCTTLASVITYIVILIKLRGVETSKASTEAILTNNTGIL